jgi:2-polyprenyl-3-methyl-5-hydroxy-6-metoxy-1,4-benzoquinol methylase
MGVAKAQRQYEEAGCYTPESLEDIHQSVYASSGVMVPYMWAAILIYAFWPSMVNHLRLYRDEFLLTLPERAKVAEFACGHGVLGLLALQQRPDISLVGIDISASAIEIARRLAEASGHAPRSTFIAGDALSNRAVEDCFDAIVAAMLAEHLENPVALFEAVERRLVPQGRAFVSTAIESAQQDHVYEFHSEGEVVAMAENAGLRVLRMVSDRSSTVTPGARFVPRACALIVETTRYA